MNKTIIFIVIFLVLINSVLAISVKEQREIAKKISKDLKYRGSLFFSGYTLKVEDLPKKYSIVENATIVLATYTSKNGNGKKDIIKFYGDSRNLSKYQFQCVVLHELGHYYDYRVHYLGNNQSREDNANAYMIKWDKFCKEWWYDNYEYVEFKI